MEEPNDEIRQFCQERGYSTLVVEGGLAYLMRMWETTARLLAEGVPYYRFEYADALDGRQILFEVVPLATEQEWEAISERLEQADATFRAATKPTETCVRASAHWPEMTPDINWWYFRIPPGGAR